MSASTAPDDMRPDYRLGQIFLQNGEHARAIAAFSAALGKDELHHGAAYGLARAHALAGTRPEAKAATERHREILDASDASPRMIRRLGPPRSGRRAGRNRREARGGGRGGGGRGAGTSKGDQIDPGKTERAGATRWRRPPAQREAPRAAGGDATPPRARSRRSRSRRLRPRRAARGRPAAARAAARRLRFRMVDVTAASGITFVSRSGERPGVHSRGQGHRSHDPRLRRGRRARHPASSRARRSSANVTGKPGFGAGALPRARRDALRRRHARLRESPSSAGRAPRRRATSTATAATTPRRRASRGDAPLPVTTSGVFREARRPRCPTRRATRGWCTSAAFFDRRQRRRPRRVRRALPELRPRGPSPSTARTAAPAAGRAIPSSAALAGWSRSRTSSCGTAGTARSRTRPTGPGSSRAARVRARRPRPRLQPRRRTDVYVANDMTPSHLWRNDRGRLTEVGVALGRRVFGRRGPRGGHGRRRGGPQRRRDRGHPQDELRGGDERPVRVVGDARIRRVLGASRDRRRRPAQRRMGVRDPRLRRRRRPGPLHRERPRLSASGPALDGLAVCPAEGAAPRGPARPVLALHGPRSRCRRSTEGEPRRGIRRPGRRRRHRRRRRQPRTPPDPPPGRPSLRAVGRHPGRRPTREPARGRRGRSRSRATAGGARPRSGLRLRSRAPTTRGSPSGSRRANGSHRSRSHCRVTRPSDGRPSEPGAYHRLAAE